MSEQRSNGIVAFLKENVEVEKVVWTESEKTDPTILISPNELLIVYRTFFFTSATQEKKE